MSAEFTDNNFKTEVLDSKVPVLVDFWAEWCGPCRAQGPVVDQIASEFQGKVKVGKLNVDTSSQTAGQFMIRSIPTILVFSKGRVAKQFVGLRSKDDLRKALNEVLAI